ncbi:MAG: hypothetical protein WAU10_10730 [Caldilineaceae bacterium]
MGTEPPKRTPRYRQMILTLWQENERSQMGPARWRLTLQNPHTEERMGFQAVEELAAFLQAWMAAQPGENSRKAGGRGSQP